MKIDELQRRAADAQRIAECCKMRAALELIRFLAEVPSAANCERIRTVIDAALNTPATDAALDVIVDGLHADATAAEDKP